jgi:hypothetical protein
MSAIRRHLSAFWIVTLGFISILSVSSADDFATTECDIANDLYKNHGMTDREEIGECKLNVL